MSSPHWLSSLRGRGRLRTSRAEEPAQPTEGFAAGVLAASLQSLILQAPLEFTGTDDLLGATTTFIEHITEIKPLEARAVHLALLAVLSHIIPKIRKFGPTKTVSQFGCHMRCRCLGENSSQSYNLNPVPQTLRQCQKLANLGQNQSHVRRSAFTLNTEMDRRRIWPPYKGRHEAAALRPQVAM